MRIKCKEGVWFKEINTEFIQCAKVVEEVYLLRGFVPTITSAADGEHGISSYHYDGLAWDWRIWGLRDPQNVADDIRKRLRMLSPRYDVVFGDIHHQNHIHIEYDTRKEI